VSTNLTHDKCQEHKKPYSTHHSIYVMHFKLVGLTSKDRYFLRKRDIERSETGAKPPIRGQQAKPLEAKCFYKSVHFLDENSIYLPISAVSTSGVFRAHQGGSGAEPQRPTTFCDFEAKFEAS